MTPPPSLAPGGLSTRAVVYLSAGLLLMVLFAFAPIFKNAFTTFDDDIWIGRNEALNPPSLGGLLDKWTDPIDGKTPGVFQNLYSPLAHTLWFLAALAGHRDTPDGLGIALDPVPFRVASLGVHLLGATGVYLLLRRLGTGRGAGLIGASIFALHPMQVESVAWASGLKDVLWTALMAWGLAMWVGCVKTGSARQGWAAVALAGLALLAKPTAVVIPGMLAWVWVCLMWRNPSAPTALPSRRAWTLMGVSLALAVPVAVMTAMFQPAPTVEAVAWWQRPLVAADALGHYLATLLYPVGLTIDYARTPSWTVAEWRWLGNALLAAAALGLVLWLRDRMVLAGAGVAVLAVAPVLGLKDFDYATFTVVTDHYGYAWMVGTAVVVARISERAAIWAGQLWDHRAAARAAVGLAMGVGLAWAGLSHLQARVWKDSGTLYLHCLEVKPRSAIVNSNYASHLYITAKLLPLEQREALVKAMRIHAGRALETWPDFPQAHYLSGMSNAILGEPREALRHYVRAAVFYARQADFQVKVGDVYAELRRLDDAERHYREALRIDPSEATAARMLDLIDQERARTSPPSPALQEPDAP